MHALHSIQPLVIAPEKRVSLIYFVVIAAIYTKALFFEK